MFMIMNRKGGKPGNEDLYELQMKQAFAKIYEEILKSNSSFATSIFEGVIKAEIKLRILKCDAIFNPYNIKSIDDVCRLYREYFTLEDDCNYIERAIQSNSKTLSKKSMCADVDLESEIEKMCKSIAEELLQIFRSYARPSFHTYQIMKQILRLRLEKIVLMHGVYVEKDIMRLYKKKYKLLSDQAIKKGLAANNFTKEMKTKKIKQIMFKESRVLTKKARLKLESRVISKAILKTRMALKNEVMRKLLQKPGHRVVKQLLEELKHRLNLIFIKNNRDTSIVSDLYSIYRKEYNEENDLDLVNSIINELQKDPKNNCYTKFSVDGVFAKGGKIRLAVKQIVAELKRAISQYVSTPDEIDLSDFENKVFSSGKSFGKKNWQRYYQYYRSKHDISDDLMWIKNNYSPMFDHIKIQSLESSKTNLNMEFQLSESNDSSQGENETNSSSPSNTEDQITTYNQIPNQNLLFETHTQDINPSTSQSIYTGHQSPGACKHQESPKNTNKPPYQCTLQQSPDMDTQPSPNTYRHLPLKFLDQGLPNLHIDRPLSSPDRYTSQRSPHEYTPQRSPHEYTQPSSNAYRHLPSKLFNQGPPNIYIDRPLSSPDRYTPQRSPHDYTQPSSNTYRHLPSSNYTQPPSNIYSQFPANAYSQQSSNIYTRRNQIRQPPSNNYQHPNPRYHQYAQKHPRHLHPYPRTY